MKKLFYLFSTLLAATFCITTTAVAATKDYLLVKDLPLIGDPGYAGLGGYLKAIFQLGIGIAVTLAVVMLVVNGIQYMFSDIPGIKVAAKNNLGSIIFGLILAFSSWLILYTINPNLVEFDFIASLREAAGGAASSNPPTGTTTPTENGQPWPSDANERAALVGIPVKTPVCTTIGQRNCTSVHGLSQNAIEGLINLKSRCGATQPGCTVRVTGGTEYWNHNTGSAHAGGRTVDLGDDAALTRYIGGAGSFCYERKVKDGLSFQWEDASCPGSTGRHWHVSF